MKKLPSKLLIMGPIFFQYCQPAQNQPKSHILIHKNVSLRDFYIMPLHKYYVHISDRHSIEKGMTHFKRSISHIAKIPSLTKKKKMSLKDILRSQLLCESPFWRIRRPSVLCVAQCEQNSYYLVPSKYTSTALKDVKTDDHPMFQ